MNKALQPQSSLLSRLSGAAGSGVRIERPGFSGCVHTWPALCLVSLEVSFGATTQEGIDGAQAAVYEEIESQLMQARKDFTRNKPCADQVARMPSGVSTFVYKDLDTERPYSFGKDYAPNLDGMRELQQRWALTVVWLKAEVQEQSRKSLGGVAA